MKIKSKYFGHEIDIDVEETLSNGEVVHIVPHDQLVEIILNSDEAIENNIQYHITSVITEPGHYAFICVISDKNGRRVEEIGESTAETLETPIARNYPALMSFKRAFDAAAIRFLGLPGKLYSDQQISTQASASPTGVTYEAEPLETDDDTSGSGDTVHEDAPSSTEEPAATSPKEETISDKKSSSSHTGKDNNKKPAKEETTYTAPPLDGMDDMLEPSEEPAKASDANTGYGAPPIEEELGSGAEESAETAEEHAVSYAAPPIEEDVGEPSAKKSAPQDEFDTTILKCGRLKEMNYSIREAYQVNPAAVRWVAEDLTPRNDLQKAQKEICKRFLKTVKEEG